MSALTRQERYRSLLTERCFQCRNMRAAGAPWEEVEKDHDACHGWYHCDPECCGSCECCYLTLEIESDLDEWEKAVTP